jgi:hypothetical protein
VLHKGSLEVCSSKRCTTQSGQCTFYGCIPTLSRIRVLFIVARKSGQCARARSCLSLAEKRWNNLFLVGTMASQRREIGIRSGIRVAQPVHLAGRKPSESAVGRYCDRRRICVDSPRSLKHHRLTKQCFYCAHRQEELPLDFGELKKSVFLIKSSSRGIFPVDDLP